MMPAFLKFLVLIGGMASLTVGLAMLMFFQRFMEFNDYINKNYLIGNKYEKNAFGFDSFVFTRSYLMAVILIVVGLALLTVFARYAPY